MTTDAQLPRSPFQSEATCLSGTSSPRNAAFTLIEVMVATVIFSLMAISVGTLFVQNNNMSMRLRYRTNANNAALNILEQIRVLDFDSLNTLYQSSAPASVTGAYIRVIAADPNAPDHSGWAAPDPTNASTPGFGADKIPLKYQNIDLLINVRDAVVKNTAWNTPAVGLPIESSATSTRMNMRYWLTLKYNTTVSGDATITAEGQVFEIILVYQWRNPGQSTSTAWESGTVRAVVPNPSPRAIGT